MIEEFKKLHDTAKLIGVLGNNDGERIGLLNKFKEIDGELKGEFGEKNIDGINFGIYHGTNKELKQALIRSGQYDVFICGHTHQREDRKEGKTQVLNPGTAHRHFPNIDGKIEDKSRIIIYDTKTKEYEFIELPYPNIS